MLTEIRNLGEQTIARIYSVGRAGLLLFATLSRTTAVFRGFRFFIQQLYAVGVLTIPIILVAAIFVGLVLAFQSYNILVDFAAESSLGLAVALSLTRELGPVLTALLFAGRAGSALTAEIGLMKTTQQLAAIEMMAVDPVERIIMPRFLAGCVCVPLLTAIFIAIGVYSAYLISVLQLGVDGGIFWSSMDGSISFREDILNGIIKSVVFGTVTTWIAVFQGHDARPTSDGISAATTATVVYSSLSILGLDYILTAIMFGN